MLPEAEVWDWLRNFQKNNASYWLYRPMSPENHYLHAILHRLEGHHLGEAGLVGFDNAKFWFGGGVEEPAWGLGKHPVFIALATTFKNDEILSNCCIFNKAHTIRLPGTARLVRIAAGWDPFAFVDLHRSVVEGQLPRADHIDALRRAQRVEFEHLFNYSLKLALNSNVDPLITGPSMETQVLREQVYRSLSQQWGLRRTDPKDLNEKPPVEFPWPMILVLAMLVSVLATSRLAVVYIQGRDSEQFLEKRLPFLAQPSIDQ